MIDLELAARTRQLIRTAKALGIDTDQYIGNVTELEKAVKIKQTLKGESSWEAQMRAYSARRKRMAAARLAGASLAQIAQLVGVSPQAVKAATSKEIPPTLRDMLARERTSRVNALNHTQVAEMLNSVTDEDALSVPVILLAARMKTTIVDKGDIELDENDPYLLDETGTSSSHTSEGQERRGDHSDGADQQGESQS